MYWQGLTFRLRWPTSSHSITHALVSVRQLRAATRRSTDRQTERRTDGRTDGRTGERGESQLNWRRHRPRRRRYCATSSRGRNTRHDSHADRSSVALYVCLSLLLCLFPSSRICRPFRALLLRSNGSTVRSGEHRCYSTNYRHILNETLYQRYEKPVAKKIKEQVTKWIIMWQVDNVNISLHMPK